MPRKNRRKGPKDNRGPIDETGRGIPLSELERANPPIIRRDPPPRRSQEGREQ